MTTYRAAVTRGKQKTIHVMLNSVINRFIVALGANSRLIIGFYDHKFSHIAKKASKHNGAGGVSPADWESDAKHPGFSVFSYQTIGRNLLTLRGVRIMYRPLSNSACTR